MSAERMARDGLIYLAVWYALGLGLAASASTKPNIVFILTDDQDVFLNGTVSSGVR